MAVKYQCPKCERRFIEWGAQKFEFKCPNCPGEELVRIGSSVEAPISAASLKRRPKKVDTRAALYDDDVDASTFGEGFEEDIDEEIVDTDVEPEIAVGKGAPVDADVDLDAELEPDLEETEEVADEEIPGALDFEGDAAGIEPLEEDLEDEV